MSIMAAIPMTLISVPAVHATGTTTNYSACADSYVDDGAATTNYGTGTSLYTNEGDPTNQNALLKFCSISVPTGVHVVSATLTFSLTDGTGGQQNGMTIKRVPRSSTWTETGVTWNNQPTPYTSYAKHVTYTGPSFAYSTQTFDVTQQVQMTNTTGDYAWQLSARNDGINPADAQVTLNSREASSGTPVLTVVTADDTAPSVSQNNPIWNSASPVNEEISGVINPNGSMTTVISQIATDSAFTQNVQCQPSCTIDSGTNIGQQPLDYNLDHRYYSLPAGTYYARIVAKNYKGTTYSATKTFTVL